MTFMAPPWCWPSDVTGAESLWRLGMVMRMFLEGGRRAQ